MNQDCLVAIVSDLHTNSTVGLSPPTVSLDDGGEYKHNAAQAWLWDKWRLFWDEIWQIGDREKLPVIAVLNGDALDGDHHNTPQIITRNPADQLAIAAAAIEPILRNASHLFVVRGTEAHVGKNAWLEEALAKDVGAIECPLGTHSWWHLLASFGGVTFDIAHHPESVSRVPRARGADANRIAADTIYEYASTGDPLPQVVIRSHAHGKRDSGLNHPVRAFLTPPWQLTTAFGHRLGAGGKVQEVGGLYFICRQGRYICDFITYRPGRAKPFVLGE